MFFYNFLFVVIGNKEILKQKVLVIDCIDLEYNINGCLRSSVYLVKLYI